MSPKSRYLLDTNILTDLIRNPSGVVVGQIEKVGEDNVCTSIVVAAELRFGAEKRNSPRLTHQLESVLSALEILPFEEPADRTYAQLRCELEKLGTPIGPNDLLIGAQALALELNVVTANLREFNRIPNLQVVNWLDAVS